MNKLSILALVFLSASLGCAEETTVTSPSPEVTTAPAPTITPAPPSTISIQEMLVSGPTQLKMHSLAMITQGNVPGGVDESYLPGLKVCAEDPAPPLRSVAAQILGQQFVQGKDAPNPEAIAVLVKLANDESVDVRYSAVYHGLTQLENKSDEIINRLITIAMTDRSQSLIDRIAESLKKDSERVARILDRKLKDGDNIAVYEIYQDLTGQQPANSDKYLEMPSSRPRLFIFSGEESDPEAYKAELEKALKAEGIENPDVRVSVMGENYVLLLKTYLTKDYITIENSFSNHPQFKITQDMWLTPELEIQIQTMQKMRQLKTEN